MADLWLFSYWEVSWFHWELRGTKGDPWVFICSKKIQNRSRNSYGYFPTGRLRDFIENHVGPKGILGCSFVPKRSKIGQEIAELWLFSYWEVACWEPHRSKGNHWVFNYSKKIQNWSRNGWVTAIFLLRGCVISLRTMWDQRGSFGFSFVPKRSKIGQEMAELWLFSYWEVVWFHWEPLGTIGDPWVFICVKEIQNGLRNDLPFLLKQALSVNLTILSLDQSHHQKKEEAKETAVFC